MDRNLSSLSASNLRKLLGKQDYMVPFPKDQIMIPYQSPDISLGARKRVTENTVRDAQELKRVFGPTSSNLVKNTKLEENAGRRMLESSVDLTGDEAIIRMPKKHWSDFPGLWKHTQRHELGHVSDYERGLFSRGGVPNLQDRLRVYKLEKRAPGIIMNYGDPGLALGEAYAEDIAQRLRRGNTPASTNTRYGGIIAHLQNNYGSRARLAKGEVHDLLNRTRHGAPLYTQTRIIEPIRGILRKLPSLLKR